MMWSATSARDWQPALPPGPDAFMRLALNAHLLNFGETYRAAGISRYIAGLLRGLQQVDGVNGYTVYVGKTPPTAGLFHADNFSVERSSLPTERPLARVAWEQVAQPLLLAARRPDLLHSLAFVSPLLWTGASVVTIYDLSFLTTPERFHAINRLYLSTMTRVSARRARRVAAISESTRADVIRLLGIDPGRVDVVYPSLEERFRPPGRDDIATFIRRKGLPQRFILHVGTLEPRKNLGKLIRAFAQVHGQDSDLKLVLAGGKGWGCDAIFAAVQEFGLSNEVVFPGYVPVEELPLWYGASTAFAYPSLYEGFGLPVLEALACGAPVVTSNGSSLPEAAGDAALQVDATDVDALAAALVRLVSDEALRANLRQRGLVHAGRFTTERMGREMVRVYDRAVAAGPADRAKIE
jgi:glycosyltransferase involved in cell wall biosynthesis